MSEMVVKKATAKAAKTTAKKATPAKKASSAKQKSVGNVYECKVCGLAVSVIDDCGCIETCDLICCEEEMKPKKTKVA
ncbi:MAG: hypothetical protein QHH30_01910 [candidate division NC10 bacterium]|nr:hypothetical protein [candidate division NC10 bacterium]